MGKTDLEDLMENWKLLEDGRKLFMRLEYRKIEKMPKRNLEYRIIENFHDFRQK
jgi:hypothetical protein